MAADADDKMLDVAKGILRVRGTLPASDLGNIMNKRSGRSAQTTRRKLGKMLRK